MGPITAIIPVPRSIAIGGRRYLATEFRLIDLAELQSTLDELEPDPLEAIRDQLDEADPQTRRLLLAEAYERAEAGPPTINDDRGREHLSTQHGITTLVWLALRRHQPELTIGDAVDVAAEMTVDEFRRLRAIAFGVSTLETLMRMLMGDDPTPSRRCTWGEAIHDVAETLGVAYPVVYEMTLTEFMTARRRGKPVEGRVMPTGENLAAAVRAQCLRFYGRPPEEVFGDGGAS